MVVKSTQLLPPIANQTPLPARVLSPPPPLFLTSQFSLLNALTHLRHLDDVQWPLHQSSIWATTLSQSGGYTIFVGLCSSQMTLVWVKLA